MERNLCNADRYGAGFKISQLPQQKPFVGRPICDLRIVTAMRLVEALLDQPITTASLAHAVGLSQFYFIRLFKDQVGETIMNYVRRIRLERSAGLMLNDSVSIVDIGLSVGYGSQSAFTRAFTQQFGVSPAHYRRRSRPLDGYGGWGLVRECEPLEVHLEEFKGHTYVARRYFGVERHASSNWYEYISRIRINILDDLNCARMEIVYDDDRITDPKRVRADLCLSTDIVPRSALDLGDKGFQIITVPSCICAVIEAPDRRQVSDLEIGALLDVWLEQRKRYRRRPSFATMKFWSPWNGLPDERPDRILVPLDMA